MGRLQNVYEAEKDLVVRRKAGGSLIDCRPVFSCDNRCIFISWGSTIRSYSVETGELIGSYEQSVGRIIAVMLNPISSNAILAVSEKWELINWNWNTNSNGSKEIMKFSKFENPIITSCHVVPCQNICYIVISWCYSSTDKCSKLVYFSFGTEVGKAEYPKGQFQCDNRSHCVDVGIVDQKPFVCGIYQNQLTVMSVLTKGRLTRAITGGRKFVCVSCHSSEGFIATGDNSGRILIWLGFGTFNNMYNMEFHWHTLPVNDIMFSQAGNYFFSGGGENVLVKWNIYSLNHEGLLPRLPGEIMHIAVAPDNAAIAVSTRDNAVHIYDPQFKLISQIQHFTWGVMPVKAIYDQSASWFPAGLVRDTRTQSLILNGRPGHIQFFSIDSGNLLYNLDITGHNYLTQERSATIYNIEVIKIAVNLSGMWLATVEHRDDGITNNELRLKFWKYDEVKQNYFLNTLVDLPHRKSVFALQFQPTTNDQQLAVTTGDDQKFRLWKLLNVNDKQSWFCECVGYYRNLPAGDVSFSCDSSLMGVAFGPTLTIWIPETNLLKCSLTKNEIIQPISHIEFGQEDCGHLIVVAYSTNIAVWNLVSLTLLWSISLNVSFLISDPFSVYMAVFSNENDVFVFSPNSPQPVFSKKSLSKSKILSAIFMKTLKQMYVYGIPWLKNSRLYFLDSNQELSVVDVKDNLETSNSLPVPIHTTSHFEALTAKAVISEVEETQKKKHAQVGIPGARSYEEFLQPPAHTMPPVSLLCGPLLYSLTINSEVEFSKGHKEDLSDEELDVSDISSDADEVENNAINTEGNTSTLCNLSKIHSASEDNLSAILKESFGWIYDINV